MKNKSVKDLVACAKQNFLSLDLILDKPRKIVIPVSGGTDSAVAFKLLSQCFPDRVIGVYARSAEIGKTSGEHLRCLEWFNDNGKVEEVVVTGNRDELEPLRWAKFISFAISNDAILASSRNRTEDTLGTYSLASRVATYLPIVCFWKYEIMQMASYLDVPEEIINSSRMPDVECGRTPEFASIPIEEVDQSLIFINSSISPQNRSIIESLINKNAFKAKLPIRHR